MSSPRLALKSTHRALGLCLAFVAGAINAGGFILIGKYTSHMTGIASSVGDGLAMGEIQMALAALGFLLSFLGGAFGTALLVNWLRDTRSGSEYSGVLLLEALLLAVLCLQSQWPLFSTFQIVCLLCLTMGLQNALITKISGSTIRTTHITGLMTDFGIELGRIVYRVAGRNNGMQTNPPKLLLFGSLIMLFIVGGIAGACLFQALGFMSLLPIAAILGVLAITLAKP